MSPAIHNAAFAHLGLNKIYLPFRVEDVVAFVESFKTIEVKGYSVTIPHKEAVAGALDEIDEMAQKIGAVNTVAERKGRLIGYNTDSSAAIASLTQAAGEGRKEALLFGKRVVVLGAGGAARALVFGLRQCGAKVTILNRTVKRAKRLAEEVGVEWGPLSEGSKIKMDILVNATSVGMYPEVDEMPVGEGVFYPGLIVFDMVYNPLETRLLREAKEAGCRCITGLDMFVEQARQQFELWTGKEAPSGLMRRIVLERLGER
jgi:3-dehydroquinate dehydratase/shikimate dehydrogenase